MNFWWGGTTPSDAQGLFLALIGSSSCGAICEARNGLHAGPSPIPCSISLAPYFCFYLFLWRQLFVGLRGLCWLGPLTPTCEACTPAPRIPLCLVIRQTSITAYSPRPRVRSKLSRMSCSRRLMEKSFKSCNKCHNKSHISALGL